MARYYRALRTPVPGRLVDINGDGLFSDLYDKARRKLTDAYHSTRAFLSSSHRTNLPPPARRTLEQHGDERVVALQVCRTPVVGAIQKLVNLLSLGQVKRAEREYGYDQLFHLYLLARTASGALIRVERNQTLNVERVGAPQGECRVVALRHFNHTLNDMFQRTVDAVGPQLFRYSSHAANCQQFVRDFLRANELPVDTAFIMQDAAALVPKYLHAPFRAVTDLASKASYLTHGVGVKKRRRCA